MQRPRHHRPRAPLCQGPGPRRLSRRPARATGRDPCDRRDQGECSPENRSDVYRPRLVWVATGDAGCRYSSCGSDRHESRNDTNGLLVVERQPPQAILYEWIPSGPKTTNNISQTDKILERISRSVLPTSSNNTHTATKSYSGSKIPDTRFTQQSTTGTLHQQRKRYSNPASSSCLSEIVNQPEKNKQLTLMACPQSTLESRAGKSVDRTDVPRWLDALTHYAWKLRGAANCRTPRYPPNRHAVSPPQM